MASKAELALILSLVDDVSKTAKEVKGELEGVGQKGLSVNSVLSGLGNVAKTVLKAGFVAAAAGITAASAALVSGIKDAADFQVKTAQLEAVLKSTKGAVGLTSKEILAMGNSLQKTTRFTDDAILEGQNLLLTFTNIGKDTFPLATKAMLDMATAMGTDASGGAIQLGKALNDPTAGISALTRVGVTFTDEQKNLIKSLQESGDMAGAQAVILQELQKEFGGSAEAAGKTFAGQLDILKNTFGDIQKEIGMKFLPVLQTLGTALMNELAKPEVQAAIDGIVNGIGNFASKLGEVVGILLQGDFPGAIDALLPQAVIDRWKDFNPLVGGLADVVKTALKGLAGANVWEDTITVDLNGVTITPGLKTLLIALGKDMLMWIGQGLSDIPTELDNLATSFTTWVDTKGADAIWQVGVKIGNSLVAAVGALIGLGVDPSARAMENMLTSAALKMNIGVGSLFASAFAGVITGSVSKILGTEEFNTNIATDLTGLFTTAFTLMSPLQLGVKIHEYLWGAIGPALKAIATDVIPGMGELFEDVWEEAQWQFRVIGGRILAAVKAIWTSITAPITEAYQPIYDAIRKPFDDAWNWIKTIPQSISNAFASIKINIPMPHFSTSASDMEIVPGTGLYWPKFDIAWYGKGLQDAVFNKPTLIGVGERGAERVSVTPLSGNTVNNGGNTYYNMTINTASRDEDIIEDFNLMVAMAGA